MEIRSFWLEIYIGKTFLFMVGLKFFFRHLPPPH